MNRQTSKRKYFGGLDGEAVDTGICEASFCRSPIGGRSHSIKPGALVVVALLGCLMLASAARAASFDCGKAGTKVEHLICDDAGISKLDDELLQSYKAALQDKAQADAIKQSQKQWMQRRNYCIDVTCIKQAYEAQLLFFKSLASIPMTTPVKTYNSDYVRDLDARTYLPAHVDRQEGDPYEAARDPNVCSLYLQNLQYFARRNIPMSCGQPIAPGLEKYIQKVEWEDLDPDKYPELFMERIREDFALRKKEPSEEYLLQLYNSKSGLKAKNSYFGGRS